MIRRDFHTYRIDDLLQEVHIIVGGVRQKGITEAAEFITGLGPLQDALVKELQILGLRPQKQMRNNGVIICDIE